MCDLRHGNVEAAALPVKERTRGAAAVYRVFRQLENGELLQVASRDERQQAVELRKALNDLWPGKYTVQDEEGNDVERGK